MEYKGIPGRMADGWPEGFTRYPSDDFETTWDSEWVILVINDTSPQAALEYMNTLKEAGWRVEGDMFTYGEAWNGEWYLNYHWDEPNFTMSLFWRQ